MFSENHPRLAMSVATPPETRADVLASDVAAFMACDSMTLHEVVEQYLAAGISKDDAAVYLASFQRALETERQEQLAAAADRHFASCVVPPPPMPCEDFGKRVVSAVSAVQVAKEKVNG